MGNRSKKRKDGSPLRVWGFDGRPPADIDKKTFEKLLAISPTLFECCSVFQCDEDTINRFCRKNYGGTFSDIHGHLAANGKISLRRKIWRLALEKEQEYAIKMLAKKHLDMDKDTPVVSINAEDLKNVNVTWVSAGEEKDHFDK